MNKSIAVGQKMRPDPELQAIRKSPWSGR